MCAALSMKFVGICYRSTGKLEKWKDAGQYAMLIVFKKVGGIRKKKEQNHYISLVHIVMR